jgi:DNA polymerase III subunit chi
MSFAGVGRVAKYKKRRTMTKVDFYTGVRDPALFACRLSQTVFARGERLLVWLADEAALAGFSTRLWSFDDVAFVPHCKQGAPEAPQTPIWLASRPEKGDLPPVLLNLTHEQPDVPEGFTRILEIVGTDETSLANARERFRVYRSMGFAIDHHDMSNR